MEYTAIVKPTKTLYSELHPGSPTLKATTLTHRSYALPIMHAYYIRTLHPVNYFAISMQESIMHFRSVNSKFI